MTGLSKSRVLLNLQCPKRLWLQINRPELAIVEDSNALRMETGNLVGEIARTLYPNGLLIDPEKLSDAIIQTKKALSGPPRPLFEATFYAEGILVRSDLLLPTENNQYCMVEVKSSTGVKDYHRLDAAMQAWVIRKNGLQLSSVCIGHIDNSFVYPGKNDYRGLFAHEDISESVDALESQVPKWIASAQDTLAGEEPCISPGEQCYSPFECPFISSCVLPPSPDEFPVEILPYGKSVAANLRNNGFNDLRDPTEDLLEKPKHRRVWRATVSGKAELDKEATDIILALPYPRYYLDFETIQFAVPRWKGTRPYSQIPFQWSCHIEEQNGTLSHTEFLADGNCDPRRQFAEALISTLGTTGPIIVYNAGFERGRMSELAVSFPDLAPALTAAIQRVFDLLPIARNHYYHPDMRGSWSIKAVLPTIAPDLSYEGLEVAHGGMAQEAFLELLEPSLAAERRTKLTAALLAYCERDTFAMVRIAQFFQNGI